MFISICTLVYLLYREPPLGVLEEGCLICCTPTAGNIDGVGLCYAMLPSSYDLLTFSHHSYARQAEVDGLVAKQKDAKVTEASKEASKSVAQLLSGPAIALLEAFPPGLWPRLHAAARDALQQSEAKLFDNLQVPFWGVYGEGLGLGRGDLVCL